MQIPWHAPGANHSCEWYPVNEEPRDTAMASPSPTRRDFLLRVALAVGSLAAGGLVNVGVTSLAELTTPGRDAPTARDRQR